MVLETLTLYVPEQMLKPGERGFIPFYQSKIWRELDVYASIKTGGELVLEHEMTSSEGSKTKTYTGEDRILEFCEQEKINPQVLALAPLEQIEKRKCELADSSFWTLAREPLNFEGNGFCRTPYGWFSLDAWLKFSKHKKPKKTMFK